jgi:hypothetical protein
MINFDQLPNTQPEQPKTPQYKSWNIGSLKFNKQCVKLTHVGHSIRLNLPKQLCDAYELNKNPKAYKAYFIYYEATSTLTLIISKNEISDADYKRSINPVGTDVCFTMLPSQLIRRINNIPEYIWLVNSDKSTDEDIILEIYPA